MITTLVLAWLLLAMIRLSRRMKVTRPSCISWLAARLLKRVTDIPRIDPSLRRCLVRCNVVVLIVLRLDWRVLRMCRSAWYDLRLKLLAKRLQLFCYCRLRLYRGTRRRRLPLRLCRLWRRPLILVVRFSMVRLLYLHLLRMRLIGLLILLMNNALDRFH